MRQRSVHEDHIYAVNRVSTKYRNINHFHVLFSFRSIPLSIPVTCSWNQNHRCPSTGKLCNGHHSAESLFELRGHPSITIDDCDHQTRHQLCGYHPKVVQMIENKANALWVRQRQIAVNYKERIWRAKCQKFQTAARRYKAHAERQMAAVKELKKKYGELKQQKENESVGIKASLKQSEETLKKYKVHLAKYKQRDALMKEKITKLTQNLNDKDRQFGNLKVKYNEITKKYRKRTRSPSNRSSAGSITSVPSATSMSSAGSLPSVVSMGSSHSGNSRSNNRKRRSAERRVDTIPEHQLHHGLSHNVSGISPVSGAGVPVNGYNHHSRSRSQRQQTPMQHRSRKRSSHHITGHVPLSQPVLPVIHFHVFYLLIFVCFVILCTILLTQSIPRKKFKKNARLPSEGMISPSSSISHFSSGISPGRHGAHNGSLSILPLTVGTLSNFDDGTGSFSEHHPL